MNSRFSWAVCVVFGLGFMASGCNSRPDAAPVGQGGASAISAPPTQSGTAGASATIPGDSEEITPAPQVADSHPAPDDTPGVDKAETDLSTNPKDAKASLRLAFAYYKAKAFAQAAPQFVQAADLAPKDPTPLFYLGYTQMAVGAFEDAHKTFAKIATLPGLNAKTASDAQLQIGNALWTLGGGKEASLAFEKSLKLNPKQGRASLALGTWAAQHKKNADAKRYFDDAARDLTTKRDRAQAYACLGRLAEDAKNTNEARANYQKSLQLDSDNEWAKRSLAGLKKG